MEPTFNPTPEQNKKPLDENLAEMYDLKIAAGQLLFESHTISRQVQMEIKDILNKVHIDRLYLLEQLAHYLRNKNPKIFEADTLTKQGHTLNESASIKALNLSDEDKALLEWYQQVRA